MIYGYYYKTLRRVNINEPCPKCGSTKLQYIDVICRVNHQLYIPCYPSKKTAVRRCDICNTTYNVNSTEQIQKLLREIKYPKYLYAGSSIFILFLVAAAALFVFGFFEKKAMERDLINEAHRGYTIVKKKSDGYKTSMLIMDIIGDTLLVRENTKFTKGSIYEIDKMENYAVRVKPLSR